MSANQRCITFRVDEELFARQNEAFQWGDRNRCLVALLEFACDAIEKHGMEAMVIFMRERDIAPISEVLRGNHGDDK